MATLHLDNLPPELLTQIEQLANQNQCSVDQQAISLLQNALKIQYSQHTTAPTQSITDILEESRHQREKLPKNIQWLDSTELIREDRER